MADWADTAADNSCSPTALAIAWRNRPAQAAATVRKRRVAGGTRQPAADDLSQVRSAPPRVTPFAGRARML
jgi:hypothetical protein